MDIILASASPRRKELLTQIGAEFQVITSDVEETITKSIPSEVVMELALQKSMDVANKFQAQNKTENDFSSSLVIGADTIVAIDNTILGKPKDKDEAFQMIKSIEGRIHQVYTGVAIIETSAIPTLPPSELAVFFDATDVEVYPMTNTQIEEYINTNEPYDKAGAYGIQGLFGKFVKGIKGDYNNVVGLPVAKIYQELKRLGIDITNP